MRKNRWLPLFVVLIVGVSGVMFMGIRTYQDAPPIPNFIAPSGEQIISRSTILHGQAAFQKHALMDYGSMFGDGAGRGPDFTADALHQVALSMQRQYAAELRPDGGELAPAERDALEARVKREIKANRYDPASGAVKLTDGQTAAYRELIVYYKTRFASGNPESYHFAARIDDPADVEALSAFYFWGGWVCGAERPGFSYSYTHNWPYDEAAGNVATSSTLLWSVFGVLGLILGLGGVLCAHGRFEGAGLGNGTKAHAPVCAESLAGFVPTPTQRATYKFFAVAAVLFVIQVLAGVLTIHDFVGFTTFFGVNLSSILPITVTRSWHLQLALLWISLCWIGASVFVLPMVCGKEPPRQRALVNLIFALAVILTLGSAAGVLLGPAGALGEWWNLLGNQGWEFVELGRLYQWLLFFIFALWAFTVFRGVRPAFRGNAPWALPHWLVYSTIAILVLFCSAFVSTPETNFVIADFWRWMVIHMWVEALFEVFTTVIVAYFMVMMGLVTRCAAARVVYIASLLFLGSGILGISHNFYWNAKPVITLAIGSVFSTLQVVPLILLTVDAWRLKQLPRALQREQGRQTAFGQREAFLFLLGVNFWNFRGAGVFGLIINPPIVNYYEHGTYLTVNHGHSAFMGVYGNLALAAMLFCCRYLIAPERWSGQLIRFAFWSLNVGLALMVVLDLFPAGVLQLATTLDRGLWYARSREFILGLPFQTLTWMRAVGGAIFFLGGVAPIAWFLVSRSPALKPVTAGADESIVAPEPAPEVA